MNVYKLLPLASAVFFALQTAALAQAVSGTVTNINESNQTLTVKTADQPEDMPESVELRLGSEADLKGIQNLSDLSVGDEIRFEARREGEQWMAESIESSGEEGAAEEGFFESLKSQIQQTWYSFRYDVQPDRALYVQQAEKRLEKAEERIETLRGKADNRSKGAPSGSVESVGEQAEEARREAEQKAEEGGGELSQAAGEAGEQAREAQGQAETSIDQAGEESRETAEDLTRDAAAMEESMEAGDDAQVRAIGGGPLHDRTEEERVQSRSEGFDLDHPRDTRVQYTGQKKLIQRDGSMDLDMERTAGTERPVQVEVAEDAGASGPKEMTPDPAEKQASEITEPAEAEKSGAGEAGVEEAEKPEAVEGGEDPAAAASAGLPRYERIIQGAERHLENARSHLEELKQIQSRETGPSATEMPETGTVEAGRSWNEIRSDFEDALDEAKENISEAGDVLLSEKQVYEWQTEDRLDRLNRDVEQLQAASKTAAEKPDLSEAERADLQKDIESSLNEIEEARKEAEKKVEDLRNAGEAEWRGMKKDTEHVLREYKSAYVSALPHIGS